MKISGSVEYRKSESFRPSLSGAVVASMSLSQTRIRGSQRMSIVKEFQWSYILSHLQAYAKSGRNR